MLFFTGRKAKGPRALESNSTVTVRLLSTCVFFTEPPCSSRVVTTLMPVMSQIFLYSGTSA
ncbi:hypothetical protein D9M72_499080 [compost metagenome]